LALCVALPVGRAEATIVVVLTTADRIIMAADSRQGHAGDINDHACKIQWAGATAVALSGNVTTSMLRIGGEVLRGAGSVGDKYTVLLRRLVQEEPDSFSAEGFVVTFAAFQQGAPALAAGKLQRPFIPWAPMFACADASACTSVLFYGETSAIDRDKDAVYAWLQTRPNEKDMIDRARLLVEAQRDAPGMAAKIGGPIDIAVIDANGARWIQVKDECRR